MLEVNMLQINVAAVLVATVASFILGFIWYAKLFAKPWIREMGYAPNTRPDGKTMAKGMALMVIGNFLFAWVLAFYFAGWRLLPGGPAEFGTLAFALNSALSVWIGFFLPVHLSRVVWEKHSWKLLSINSGYHLVATGVVALIIAYWI
ncbi:MAG: DUF1761 domain-containing protein [Ignavibacteriales bacterium]|nr:DUF1761 domain-containing protein [Ignavibacteriales bacterium]